MTPAYEEATMSSADDAPVLVERIDAVARIVLNRPASRNALDASMKSALLAALAGVAEETGVRAVVLTGAGDAFCVGQDLGEHAQALNADASTAFATVREHYSPIVATIATMPKPVVAAVKGACVGAGLGFALACDLKVWSAQATLATAFTGIGLTCDSGLSATLARSLGEGRAKELVLLGTRFTPAEAVAWGLGGQVVAPEAVDTTVAELAQRLAAGPTTAYAESKRLIAAAAQRPLSDTLAEEALAQARCGLTADHKAAVAAFLSKQRPAFVGA
jgi:2-(1,2-epoxy-1,2-dihydrophenyl)acetyl-CoA isomerase